MIMSDASSGRMRLASHAQLAVVEYSQGTYIEYILFYRNRIGLSVSIYCCYLCFFFAQTLKMTTSAKNETEYVVVVVKLETVGNDETKRRCCRV